MGRQHRKRAAGWKERIAVISNEEFRARIHIMVDDIESSHRIRQLHALIYRMHELDVADRLRTESTEIDVEKCQRFANIC